MKAQSKPKVLPPVGSLPARIYRIIYMGTVKGEYKGVQNESYKVNISWELPTKTHVFKEGEAAKPFVVSKQFSLSMGKKSSLRPVVEGMLGVSFHDDEAYSFDIDELLGQTCLIGIAHKDTPEGKKVELKSFSQIPDGMTVPPAINTPVILSYEKFDKDVFMGLPDWMTDMMKKTPEYQKLFGSQNTEEIEAEDVPF